MKKALRGIIAVAAGLFMTAIELFAVTDDNWASMGGLPGLDGTVFAVARHDGALYAGGDFTIAGTIFAKHIAKWDGEKWNALGAGLNGRVKAIAFDAAGVLYAGGSFTKAGGVAANGVAKWDGEKWSALGTGLTRSDGETSSAYALAFAPSGDLYAGGSFTIAGGVAANRLAKWDGTNWSALESVGMSSSVCSLVFNTAGELYAAGYFSKAGGTTVNGVARWDGEKWNALGSGMGYAGQSHAAIVYALTFDAAGTLYAAGWFSSPGRNIAKWNGSSWSALSSGLSGFEAKTYVYSLAFDAAGTLYAGGYFSTAGGRTCSSFAQWNGLVWSATGSGVSAGSDSGKIYSLANGTSDELYAAGSFGAAGDIVAARLVKWDGEKMGALGTGLSGVVTAVIRDAADNFYVLHSSARISKWDGQNWTSIDVGYWDSVTAIAVNSSGDLYAGGIVADAEGDSDRGVAKWDGARWTPLGDNRAENVNILQFSSTGELYLTHNRKMLKWDGASWGEIDLGVNVAYIHAVTADTAGNIFIGCDQNVDIDIPLVLKWDGQTCGVFGEMKGFYYIAALAFNALGELYVGGAAYKGGERLVGKIAKWNGKKWSEIKVGQGPKYTRTNQYVKALACDTEGNLYVAGDFNGLGGAACNGVAKWDGKKWNALGSGVNFTHDFGDDYPYADVLAFDAAGDLYVGGDFTTAGDKVCGYIAKCLDPGAPNPATVTVTFAAGENGSLDKPGAQTVKFNGNSRAVKAIPNSGHMFQCWRIGEKTYATANPLTVKNVQSDMALTAIFAAVPDGFLSASVTSSYAEVVKSVSYPDEGLRGVVERYVQARDKYGFKCVIQMKPGWENIAEDDEIKVAAGLFYGAFALTNFKSDEEIAVCALNGAKGGSASWTYKELVETDQSDVERYATVRRVSLKWTAKGVMTLTVTGSPLPDSEDNVCDLLDKPLGSVQDVLPCEIAFGAYANATFQLPYSGVRSERTARWSEDGEIMEQPLESWNVKGTVKIAKR